MKNRVLILGLLSIICLSFTKTNTTIDEKIFLGSWKGNEKDNQIAGLSKHWIQHRFNDGTFILMFTTIEDCEVDSFVENGKWWVKDGLFHELHNNSGKTDIYSYEILDNDHIKFKAKQLGIDNVNEEYEFIDERVED